MRRAALGVVVALVVSGVGCARDGKQPSQGEAGDVGLDAPCGAACADVTVEDSGGADGGLPDAPVDAAPDGVEDLGEEPAEDAPDALDAGAADVVVEDIAEEAGVDASGDVEQEADAPEEPIRIAGLIALHEYTLVAPTNPVVRKLATTLAVFTEPRPEMLETLNACLLYQFGGGARPSPTFDGGNIRVTSDVQDFVLEPSEMQGEVVYTSTLPDDAVELFGEGLVTFGVEGGELDAALLMRVEAPPEPGYVSPQTGCRLGEDQEVSWEVMDPASQLSIEIIPLDQFLQPKPGRAVRCPLSPERGSFVVPGSVLEELPAGAYALLVSRRVEVSERVGRDVITFGLGSTAGVVCSR